MYKRTLCSIIFSVLLGYSGYSQQDAVNEVKKSIEIFFEGFHQQDSTIIKSVVSEGIVLQTIGVDREGNNRLRTDPFDGFLHSILSIPDSVQYREEILGLKIQIDGPMAHVWTPYTFWVNGEISHCGVNSFQLFNDDISWKIIYLADTRRKDNCKN